SRRLAKLPVIESAVHEGVLGRAQAAAIIGPLIEAADRAETALMSAACTNLIELSKTLPATAVVEAAEAWKLVLDPDGIEPVEKAAIEKRFFRLGHARDGLVRLTGLLPVEQAAAIRAVLDAYVNPRTGSSVRFTPTSEATGASHTDSRAGDGAHGASAAGDGGTGAEPEVDGSTHPLLTATEVEPPTDTRTREQKQADVIHAVFAAAARAPETPTMGGAHPTVLIVVNRDDFQTGHGTARIDGEDHPITAQTARR
ncbi:DUF222 domain-containing protein, partial [Gryllotalpicola kribbensis]|uniref:DUF222 domain-containing protein n=1 Tax=Gryllotalpicola kribbensis TaxID=993084 RepID=UPI0031DF95CF